jgi:hypothetical protein
MRVDRDGVKISPSEPALEIEKARTMRCGRRKRGRALWQSTE